MSRDDSDVLLLLPEFRTEHFATEEIQDQSASIWSSTIWKHIRWLGVMFEIPAGEAERQNPHKIFAKIERWYWFLSFKWRRNVSGRIVLNLQIVQKYCLLSCVIICFVKWHFLVNSWSQMLHLKGFSPVWILKCRSSSAGRTNFLSHIEHVWRRGSTLYGSRSRFAP